MTAGGRPKPETRVVPHEVGMRRLIAGLCGLKGRAVIARGKAGPKHRDGRRPWKANGRIGEL